MQNKSNILYVIHSLWVATAELYTSFCLCMNVRQSKVSFKIREGYENTFTYIINVIMIFTITKHMNQLGHNVNIILAVH